MAAAPGSPRNRRNSRITARLPRYVALGVVLVALSVLAAGAAAAPAESLGAAAQQQRFTVTPLVPASRVEGAKSASGRIAQTDESLLGLSSDAPVNVVVKLDYDAVASYAGQIEGLPATSPAETGKPLNMQSNAAQSYLVYVRDIEQRFLARLDTRVPDADVGRALRVAYGGVALTVPGNEVGDALEAPRRRRGPGRQPGATPHRLEPRVHRRPDDLRPARRQRQRSREGRHRRRARHRRLAGASVVRRSRHPAGPAAEGRRHASDLQLRRQPADPGDRRVRLPAASSSRASRSLPPTTPSSAARSTPTSARDSNGHGTHTSSTSAGGPVATRTRSASTAARSAASLPARTSPSTRTAAPRAASPRTRSPPWPGDPRRRPRDQLLDRRRRGSIQRPGRARLPRRLRGGCPRVGMRGQRRPGPGDQRPQLAVGHHRRRLHPGADVPLDDHGQRQWRRDAAGRGATITAGIGRPLPVVLGSAPPYNNVGCTAPAPPGHLHRQDRRLRAGPRPHHPRLQRPTGRRRGDDPLQRDAARRDDGQPLASDRPHHHAREPAAPRLPGGEPGRHGVLHRRARRRPGRATASPTSRRAAPEGTG